MSETFARKLTLVYTPISAIDFRPYARITSLFVQIALLKVIVAIKWSRNVRPHKTLAVMQLSRKKTLYIARADHTAWKGFIGNYNRLLCLENKPTPIYCMP